jgi:DNA-binding CsgD family transcriptional regulator
MRSREAKHVRARPTRAHTVPVPGPADQAQAAPPTASAGPSWREGIKEAIESGRSVVVAGPAGIGKTHLVNAALRGGAPAGTRVVDLTPVVLDGAGQGSLDHLLDGIDIRRDPTAAADALWAWSSQDGSGERVLLRLENAHLVDDASLAVVERVAARPEVTVVNTTRADPSLGPLLPGLEDVARFTVRPLDNAGVETLLVEILGGFPTADTVHRLWVATRGNPLYLCELVRDQRERGTLVSDDGIWVWTGTATLSRRVLDSTVHDLGHLAPDERDVVELAAIAGPVPAEHIGAAPLARLLRLGMLRPTSSAAVDPPRYEVVHPIQADAICALIGTRRRRELLARAGDWAEAPAGQDEDLVRSVAWSLSAEVAVAVPEVLRASGQAVRADDPYAAVELTSTALLRATAGSDSVAILTTRADAHLHLNNTDAALEDLAQARATIERLDLDDQGIDAYLRTVRLEAMVRHFLSSDLGATLAALEAAASWLEQHARQHPSAARAVTAVETLRLAHLAWGGRHPEMLEPAVTMLHAPEHAGGMVPLLGPTLFALSLAGRAEEGRQLSLQYLPVVTRDPSLHRWEPSTFSLSWFFTLVLSGDLDAAETTAPITSGMVDMVSRHQRAGVLAAARGDWSAARHQLRAANARLRRRDSLGILPYTLAVEAMVAAASGEAAGARTLLDEFRATPRRCSQVAGAYLDLYALDALVWLHDGTAPKVAARLARTAALDGHAAIELEALHRVALVAGPAAVQDAVGTTPIDGRLAWLADRVDGDRNRAVLAHLQALVGRRPRQIEQAHERLQEVGLHLPGLARPTRLTRREREIATLAAGGMTSKAIAQRLVLSVRTIDSHLAGAYAKLGVHSREGLQKALADARR